MILIRGSSQISKRGRIGSSCRRRPPGHRVRHAAAPNLRGLTEGAGRQSDWDSGRRRETVRDGETPIAWGMTKRALSKGQKKIIVSIVLFLSPGPPFGSPAR